LAFCIPQTDAEAFAASINVSHPENPPKSAWIATGSLSKLISQVDSIATGRPRTGTTAVSTVKSKSDSDEKVPIQIETVLLDG
jgi:hypothetical protein